MSTGSHGEVWSRFEHDPRDPAYAGMRASERDRDVVRDLLASAYAEGRLDRDEHDERTSAVATAKTYADLLPPIRDLTTDAVPSRVAATPTDLRRSAELHYSSERREAIFGFLVPNLVCWAIWMMTMFGDFPWPIFVTIPTGLNLLRVLVSRQEIVEKRIEKLERRRAKELEAPTDGADTDEGSILGEERRRDEA